MRKLIIQIVTVLMAATASYAEETSVFSNLPLPVYSTPADAAAGHAIRMDRCGQVRSLEFIALAGTQFDIIRDSPDKGVLEVSTPDYSTPSGGSLFIKALNLTLKKGKAVQRNPQIPSKEVIVERLKSAVGLPYVWGGNTRGGITAGTGKQVYKGLDCSGLLYEATDGATPRNTEQLVGYGLPVAVAGKDVEKMLDILKPLDLIVWKGHVVIVLDRENTVESLLSCGKHGNGGVRLTPLKQRLKEIMSQRKGVDIWPEGKNRNLPLFVVRRWL